MQIAVPNSTSEKNFMLLVQAFLKASRLPYPIQKYFASNVVYGVGFGTSSLVKGVCRGVGGVIYEPYRGAKTKGFKGGCYGMAKGIGGLVGRPIKGGFDFVAQPLVGVLNTPTFIYKKYWSKQNGNI